MKIALTLFLLCSVSWAGDKNVFRPVIVEADLIRSRPDLEKDNAKLATRTTNSLGSMMVYAKPSEPGIQVLIPQELAEFLLDLRSALRKEVEGGTPGSEMLFSGVDFNKPQLDKLKKLDYVIQFATSALLQMPDGALFFETPSGNKLRAIFSKIRTAPNTKLNLTTLTEPERAYLAVYLGSIFWRIRGGGLVFLPEGTQDKRKYYTEYSFTALGELIGKDLRPIALSHRRALQLKGWGEWRDMGRQPHSDTELADLIHMADRGIYQVDGTFDDIKKFKGKPDLMRIAGSMMGPCYYWMWNEFGNDSYGKDLPRPYTTFLNKGAAWGEVCAGGAIALGLVRALPRP